MAHWDSGINVVTVQKCVLDGWISFSTFPRSLGTLGPGPYIIFMRPNSGQFPVMITPIILKRQISAYLPQFVSSMRSSTKMRVFGHWTGIYWNLWAWHAISITIIRKYNNWISLFSIKLFIVLPPSAKVLCSQWMMKMNIYNYQPRGISLTAFSICIRYGLGKSVWLPRSLQDQRRYRWPEYLIFLWIQFTVELFSFQFNFKVASWNARTDNMKENIHFEFG